MAIPYRVVQKGQPGVVGGGVKKFYASIATIGKTIVDKLTKNIEKFSALSKADICGVIITLENRIKQKLVNTYDDIRLY